MQKAEWACLHLAAMEPYFPRENGLWLEREKQDAREKKKTDL